MDPEEAVDLYMSAYQNTPHSATGEKPSKLMFGRDIQTKLPQVTTPSTGDHHDRARSKNEEYKKKTKERYDKKHRTTKTDINEGDKTYLRRKTTTKKGPWDPNPFTVTQVKGDSVTANRGKQTFTRH